jgi:predicted nuclease of predicted toxin-antitoxin system
LKFFIDESLSPELALRLNEQGFDAVHPLHVGRRGEPDYLVLRRCIDEDRVIATQNKRDFQALLRSTVLHPGLIFMPAVRRQASWRVLQAIIQHIADQPSPDDYLINRVLEAAQDGTFTTFLLPPLP